MGKGERLARTLRDRPRVRRRERWLIRLVDTMLLAMLSVAGMAIFVVQQQSRPQQVVSVVPSPTSTQSETTQQIQPADATVPKVQTLDELVYNVQQAPPLEHDEALQAIVDGAMALAASKDLSTEPLSITLIDLKSNKIAGYQNQTLRYPASVVKLFWLVICEAQLDQGFLKADAPLAADLNAMVVYSDNDAASRVFDRITQTTSGDALSGTEYDTWLKHRLQINQFFRAAGYDGLSISQKNYPIYSLKLDGPDGRELQMHDEQQQPIRSLMSSDQAARLLYEIYTGKAVSASRSQEMMALLTRDLHPEAWKQQPDNSIAGFLGEPLPPDVRFASKVGLTTKVRNEVAFIESADGETAYILAVFGADPTYSQSADILPAISHAVYTQMVQRAPQHVGD